MKPAARQRMRAGALERIELLVVSLLVLSIIIGGATLAYVEAQIRQTFAETLSIDPSATLRPITQLQRELLRMQVEVRGITRSGVVDEAELRLHWDLMRSRVLVLTDDLVGQRLQPEGRAQLGQVQEDVKQLEGLVDRMLGGVVAGSPVEPAQQADVLLSQIERTVNAMAQTEGNARSSSASRVVSLIGLVRAALAVLAVLLVLLTGSLVFVTRRVAQARVRAALQELETARSIQQALLPQKLPPVPGLEMAWHFRAAAETSGDFYDFLLFSPHRVGLVVADVTGHGMAAALIASGARQTLRSELFHHQDDLARALAQTNRWLYTDMPQHRFVAASCALFDTQLRRLVLANAGQMSPLLFRQGALHYLEPPGLRLPLGISQAIGYDTLDMPLEIGDLLIFYTDGIVEAQNLSGELFGFERLEQVVREAEGSAAAISEQVLHAIAQFSGQQVPLDDITLVVVRALAVPSDQLSIEDSVDNKGAHVVA